MERPTFDEIERAIDAGKAQMVRPWGDWVHIRRRARTVKAGSHRVIPVYMENEVEANISTDPARIGFPDVRIIGAAL